MIQVRFGAVEEDNLEIGPNWKRTEKILSNLGKSITQKRQEDIGLVD